METKVIFLDIDGVLATHKEFMTNRTKFRSKYWEAMDLRIPYPFNMGCVEIFNEIIQETNPKIILSSDWRLHWDLIELDKIFKFNGVIKSPEDFTGVSKWNPNTTLEEKRVSEITTYLESDNIKTWVCIDDMDLSNLGSNFIQTKDNEGLKQTGIKKKIIEKLNP